jgi:hypothetical protein
MGVAFCVGHCIACRAFLTYNPMKVPSIRVKDGKPDATGSREPLCRSCAETLYARLKAEGKTPPPISEDAYEACDEGDVSFGGD